MKERVLAGWLRRRMQGTVPAELLATISDEDLIRQYQRHHEQKLERFKQKRERRELARVLEQASA